MWKTWGTSSSWKGGGIDLPPASLLGITLDTSQMEICLPDEKLLRIRNKILNWLPKKIATKREILSLVGLLQHASKVVRCGHTFVGRMYQAAAKVKELTFFTRLTKEFRSDLFWWHFLLTSWNGLSLLHSSNFRQADCCIQTYASDSWGCGAVFGNHWFQWPWPVFHRNKGKGISSHSDRLCSMGALP